MTDREQTETIDPGPMRKRRLTLPDGRYEIFYTFGAAAASSEVRASADARRERAGKEEQGV
jgi:hypothetical protein